MITCVINYIIEPNKTKEFEYYAKLWIPLVNKFRGQHHGYFLPSEGANNVALALFTFPSLAEYEQYRLSLSKTFHALKRLSMERKRNVLKVINAVFFDPCLNNYLYYSTL